MKRALVLPFVAALFLAGAAPADAAIRKWSVEPAVHGAWMKIDKDLNVDDTSFSGVSLSLSVTPAFQVEAMTSTLTTESDFLDRSDDEYKQDMTGLRVIGTFLSDQDVRTMPYLAAGTGRIKTAADRGGNRAVFEDESSYSEVALGTRIFIWKDFNIRPELGLRHSRTINIAGRDTTHANFYFSVGLSWFLFGSK